MGLKVAIIQMDIRWEDKQANLQKAEQFIMSAQADIAVLPEMFSTGFDMNPAPLAEDMDGHTVGWFRRVARESEKAVAGSVIISEDGQYRNRFLFVKPNGELTWYDKRHLFSFAGENDSYKHGDRRVVVEYLGFRILLLICYDLRFPVWIRNRRDYDMIINVASWAERRISAWDALLRARAIENQAYVVGVNRVGIDPEDPYPGHSVALDYLGNTIASLPEGEEGVAVVEIEMDPLLSYREKFRAWQDADDFEVKL